MKLLPSILKPTLALLTLSLLACGGGSSDDGPSNTQPPPDISDDQDQGQDQDQEDQNDTNSGNGSQEPEDIAQQIHSLGIGDAQGFVVTGRSDTQNTLSASSSDFSRARGGATHSSAELGVLSQENDNLEPGTLYKVTTDGRMERVPFVDDAGTELNRGALTPTSLTEIGPDFVYIRVDINTEHNDGWFDSRNIGLLVNKASGLAFLGDEVFGNIGWFDQDTRPFSNSLRFDPQGNIYLIRSGDPTRVDISNLGRGDLTAETLANVHGVNAFELSDDGEILVYRGNNDNSDRVDIALNPANGALTTLRNLPGGISNADPSSLIRGLDGNLYLTYLQHMDDDRRGYEYRLLQLSKDSGGQVIAQDLGLLDGVFASGADIRDEYYNEVLDDYSFSNSFGLTSLSSYSNPNGRQVVNGRLIYSDSYSAAIYEVDIQNRTIIQHDEVAEHFNTSNNIDILPTDRYLWVSGTSRDDGSPTVVRYNPASTNLVALSFDPDFELRTFEPMGDRILFEALRLSDQATVVGEMTVEGDQLITEVYEATAAPILTLRAIQPSEFISVDGSPNDWDIDFRMLSATAGSGAEGSDLRHYSELNAQDEYLGLVEFEGSIDREHFTRVRFDTHELIIQRNSLGIRTSAEDFSTKLSDGLAEGARLAYGSALEFAVPLSLLGGSQPNLVYVDRYEMVRYGAVAGVTEVGDDEGQLEFTLELDSPLGDEELFVTLTNNERVRIRSGEVTLLNDNDSSEAPLDNVSFPESDEAGGTILVAIEVDMLDNPEAVNVVADNPEGVLREEPLDSMAQ